MTFYFLELKRMQFVPKGYPSLHPLRKAIPLKAKDWNAAKKEAEYHQVYRDSVLYVGTAVIENGCIDTEQEYIYCDKNGWHQGK